ncbi:MAG: heparan-alpha-glucosaminide N-acetyltransferase [Alphaproteobacteria bacterium]
MGSPPAGGRLAGLDLARGLGIVLMVIYHGFWDADHFSLLPAELFDGAFWKWFRFAILATFVLIAGVSLSLAHAKGLRGRAFLRRLAILAVCAGAITGVSALAFPQQLIFFGVLHAIAVSSVLGLAFVGLAWGWTALAGIAVVALAGVSIAGFDTPWLGWIGFMPEPPSSRDYVPLFPWAGVFFLGIALGRGIALGHLARRRRTAAGPGYAPRFALGRWLASGGRHSLPIYMLHQPILFALLFGLAWLTAQGGDKPSMLGLRAIDSAAYARSFIAACRKSSEKGGLAPKQSAAYCRCMLGALRGRFTAAELHPDKMTPKGRAELREFGKKCIQETLPPTGATGKP